MGQHELLVDAIAREQLVVLAHLYHRATAADGRLIIWNTLRGSLSVFPADQAAVPAFEEDKQCRKCVILPNCQGNSCPLVRIRTQQSPCLPTRRRAKQQLLETLEYQQPRRLRDVPMLTR